MQNGVKIACPIAHPTVFELHIKTCSRVVDMVRCKVPQKPDTKRRLEEKRFQYDVCFVHKVVCGKVDSAYLLGCFPLHVPQRRTRAGPAQLLHIPSTHQANKETIMRGLFRRAILAFNAHVGRMAEADPFHAMPSRFRASVRNLV